MLSAIHDTIQAALLATRVIDLRLRLPRMLVRYSLQDLLARLSTGYASEQMTLLVATQVIHRAEAIVVRVPRVPNTCLYRALARYAAYRRAGLSMQFVMGVRTDSDGLIGHAWLEYEGLPYAEKTQPDYRVTFRYPDIRADSG